MKLVGYIKDKNENSFPVPVYSNKENNYYFHTIDSSFNITHFIEAEFDSATFKKLYLSKTFEISSKGALVFIGEDNYIKYDSAENAIEEILSYINDEIPSTESKQLLKKANALKKTILSDKFIVNNFKVNINPQKEQFILTFDFPSPKKGEHIQDNFSEVSTKDKISKNLQKIQLDTSTNPAYKSILEYLTRVNLNVELTLKLRANERRNKLKTLNYQFKMSKSSSRKSKPND
jgi:hypothetical protein